MQPELPKGLDPDVIRRVIDDALEEDLGLGGDITSEAVIPVDVRFCGVLEAREAMVVAGLSLAGRVFFELSEDTTWQPLTEDGAKVPAGTQLARVEGPARALLTAERTALNLLQHLSGIATLTRTYVDAIQGTGAHVLDTRKTVPGLRDLAKYATLMGGATNHRMRLDDAVLIKDNHIAVAGSVTEAITRAKAANLSPIEVECDTLEQVKDALAVGVDAILLDNMDLATLGQAVALIKGQARSEASGGVTLDSIRAIAETGVDSISIGRLTQSAPAVDIGLDWNERA